MIRIFDKTVMWNYFLISLVYYLNIFLYHSWQTTLTIVGFDLIHCVKWGVSWCWNHTIRTRILREYGHTRTYRVPRHATCPPRVRNRIRSDSDLTRVMGNPMSGYVIDTRRVETWKFPYTFRFAANNNVPHTSAWSVSLRLFVSF